MGCTSSKSAVDNSSDNKKFIDELRSKKTDNSDTRTILLLGAGESGKSTIAKQIKLLYLGGFSNSEALRFKDAIQHNIISSMKALIFGVISAGKKNELDSDSLKLHYYNVVESDDRDKLTADLAESIKKLWQSPILQDAWLMSNKLQVIESAAYFFGEVDRIAADDYMPSDLDILRCRAKTTGTLSSNESLN